MMLLHYSSLILFIIHLVGFSRSQNYYKNRIDLEIYSNLTEFKDEIKSNRNDDVIINVCDENERSWFDISMAKNNQIKYCVGKCHCSYNAVKCIASGINNLNIKAIKENFIGKEFWILHGNDFPILEKNKIFPTSEDVIEKLHFGSTTIFQIDDGAFDRLSSLKYLEFTNTRLEKIDENVLTQNLGKTLKTFSFTFNRMSVFDPTIFKYLVNLEELDLKGNIKFGGKIENQFPKSLSKLKVLNLQNCGFSDLDENVFEHLKNLEIIVLNHNYFTSIPSAINVLTNLRAFHFSNNLIEILEKNSFLQNTKLKILLFTENRKLKSIEDCAFCKLPNLKLFDFHASQQLSQIHGNAFGFISNGYVPNIKLFLIEYCKISVLPEKLLNWKNVEKLSINHNPLECNCFNAWLFNDLLSNNSIYKSQLWSEYGDFYKYNLGCLGSLQLTPNQTLQFNEIFSTC